MTPPARRPKDETRAPATLVEAIFTRSRTRVRFPPSPYFSLQIEDFTFGHVAAKTVVRSEQSASVADAARASKCGATYRIVATTVGHQRSRGRRAPRR